MPFKLQVKEGNTQKNYSVYSKSEIDRIMPSGGGSSGGSGSSGRSVGRLSSGGGSAGANYLNAMFNKFYNSLESVGEITQDLSGTYTSVPSKLKGQVTTGTDYYIINEKERDFYTITPTVDIGPGTVDITIQEQIIEAPSESRIVKVPGQDQAKQQKLDDKQVELDTKTDDLDSRLVTLDGYIDDPSTIPADYTFFEGIVAEDAFINDLVARTLFANELVANNTFTDGLVAKDAYITNLVARNLFATELVANSAFITDLTTDTAFVNELTANTAFIDELWTKNASVENTLTMGVDGKITNTNDDFFISPNGISVNTTSNFGTTRAFKIETLAGSVYASLYGNNAGIFLESDLGSPIRIDADQDLELFSSRNILLQTFQGPVTLYSDERVDLNSALFPARMPRVTETRRDSLSALEGDMVFNTTTNEMNYYTGTGWVRTH